MTDIGDQSVLARRLDVTTRLPDSVRSLLEVGDEDVLLETLVGRYVLNRDARAVWRLLDGSRTVAQIARSVHDLHGVPLHEATAAVTAVCGQLIDYQLADIVSTGGRG